MTPANFIDTLAKFELAIVHEQETLQASMVPTVLHRCALPRALELEGSLHLLQALRLAVDLENFSPACVHKALAEVLAVPFHEPRLQQASAYHGRTVAARMILRTL